MAPKRPAGNNTQKSQTQQATLNKNIPQQPKVTTNNKNNQKLSPNIEKYPDNPEMCQNSYKKVLGGPQSAQKVPRPSQNLPKTLPKTLPKPSPNPSQIFQKSQFYLKSLVWPLISPDLDPKPRQDLPKSRPKSTKNQWKIDVEKNMFLQCVFASIFFDFRFQKPSILVCILELLATQVPKMQNLRNMHFT